jgi:hypothetical protein
MLSREIILSKRIIEHDQCASMKTVKLTPICLADWSIRISEIWCSYVKVMGEETL